MRLITHLSILSILASLCSCYDVPKGEHSTSPEESKTITITADRATGDIFEWRKGDRVAVVENNTTLVTTTSATVNQQGLSTFTFTVAKDDTRSGFCYDAIYPARALPANLKGGSRVTATIPSEQTIDDNMFDRSSFIALAERVVCETQPDKIDMHFNPIVAIGTLSIRGLGDELNIEHIRIKARGINDTTIALAGDIDIDLAEGGHVRYASDSDASDITLDIGPNVEHLRPIYFCCTPCELRAGERIDIEVATNEGIYTSTIDIESGDTIEFKANHVTAITAYFSTPLPPEDEDEDEDEDGGDDEIEEPVEPTPSEQSEWLEMPAAKNLSNSYPEAVTITIMSGDERNYTHYYDVETYTSLWVAYPLEGRHMGSLSRPGGWDWNPYLSTAEQVNLCSRSYAGDYSRGHLIPNASRNGIREMQLQTFYVTNSVPQIQGGFNGGIWQKLEAAIQSEAERERLYVVTGVAFNKVGESKTIKYTKAKDDTKDVPVPNYFYKVVLKVKYDDAGDVVDAESVGFWFEHRTYSDSYTNYSVSVDSIEQWTGFDYFVNLPDSVEAKAEKNDSWSRFTAF